MFYTIYKVTHKESGKVYIGKHQTQDINDSYMGSGKLISRAIKKYGVEAFEKEVLHVFDNEADMNQKEAELVTEEFCLREDTYNLCPGGRGGWGYVNQNILTYDVRSQNGKIGAAIIRERWRGYENPKYKPTGKPKGASGESNSQFGKRWITDGITCYQINKDDELPVGFQFGKVKKVKPTKQLNLNKKNRLLAFSRFEEWKKSGLSIRKYAKLIGVSQPAISGSFKKYKLYEMEWRNI